ncbi:MAG: response regulator [bacterium]|nr:response regulator [bacterium]
MKHVLVVEDDESVCELLMRHLRRAGHTFMWVSDGQQAWEALDDGKKFYHVISDHQMPGMTGVELLRRMKADYRTEKIPFALVSGATTVSEEDKTPLNVVCAKLGATFHTKPCDYDKLIAQLLGDEVSTDFVL